MNFTIEGLKQKYENKKKNAKSRNIDFSLTEDEFIKLCLFLKENRQCAYTNETFVFKSTTNGTPKPNYPTLERVDNSVGYVLGNVIWVTYHSNFIKSKWEDNLYSQLTFSKIEFKTVQQILGSKDKVEAQLNNIYQFVKGESTVVTESKQENENLSPKQENNNSDCKTKNATDEVESKTYEVNDDVELAQMYTQFAAHCRHHVDFLLSFNEYKKLMSRKQCQLSMQKFDEEHKKSLFVIDKTKAVNVKNLLVIDLKLRHQLDTFISKMKMDQKVLKKIFINLSNSL
ncbi:hypothetical protein phiA019_0043 [Aeromonas phage phiA019]|nr:hypothetical protein phiA009_0047 [Aeromonas phage phiA009]ULG01580.1 hypothetical protein phiA019_0043 [Aeromonas phage phiA019]